MATSITSPQDEEEDALPSDDSEIEAEQGDQDAPDGDPLEGKEHLQKALYGLYLKCCEEDRFPRICEIMDVQQAHDYWRGLQYRWWSRTNECWNFPNENNGLQTGTGDDDGDMPRFEFVTNIYLAFGLSLVAAMSQAPPRTRWFPDDAEEPKDITTAEGFEKLAKIIERWNPIQIQLQDEIFQYYTGGIIVGWTRYVSDGDKYGTDEVEDLEPGEASGDDEVRCAKCGFSAPVSELPVPGTCPQCGSVVTEDNVAPAVSGNVPSSGGKESVAKGRQIISVYGALNFKRNQYAKEQSEYLYCSIEEEIHYAKLRAAYPDIAKKIKPGQGIGEDNGFERNARLAVMQGTNLSQQTGEAQSVLTTFARVWFRPDSFFHDSIKEEDREELLEIFPRGVRVYFAGPEYCESEEQSMDDCLTVAHAIPGDGQHRNGLGSPMISLQDRYNTWSNIEAETYEYGIPITYRSAAMFDPEADREQVSQPGATIDVRIADGVDINTKVATFRADEPSAAMTAGMDKLMGPTGQFITGAFTALQGAGGAEGAAGDTASGYKMQMDQALGRVGISYVRLKQFHADIQTLACKDFCRNASGKVGMAVLGKSGDFESDSIDVTALEGDARAYPEGDENFPELWSQQRATFMQIMDSPQGQALMQEPDNAELGVKLIGIPNLVLPGADDRRQAMRIIGELTETVPSEDPEQPDMSPDLRSQIQSFIDPLDNHAIIGETCKRWRITAVGVKCKKENPPGYDNVTAYAMAQLGMVPKPPAPTKPISASVTMAVDKMPPKVQADLVQSEFGIETDAEDFVAQAALKAAEKSKPDNHASPSVPPENGNPVEVG